MFLKREKEFQYPPAIEKIIEDVIGGGTIARADFLKVYYGEEKLDELPPYVVVVKDSETGLYHAIKTATIQEAAASDATAYKVHKNHLFAVGDFVTVGGYYTNPANVISAIDKSNKGYDVLTLAATIGEASLNSVLVLAKEAAEEGYAQIPYEGELAITMSKVDLTVANQLAGLLVRGTVNELCMPCPIDAGLKGKMPLIRFINK